MRRTRDWRRWQKEKRKLSLRKLVEDQLKQQMEHVQPGWWRYRRNGRPLLPRKEFERRYYNNEGRNAWVHYRCSCDYCIFSHYYTHLKQDAAYRSELTEYTNSLLPGRVRYYSLPSKEPAPIARSRG